MRVPSPANNLHLPIKKNLVCVPCMINKLELPLFERKKTFLFCCDRKGVMFFLREVSAEQKVGHLDSKLQFWGLLEELVNPFLC